MHILLKKLTSLHDLTDEEQQAILNGLSEPRSFVRGDDIVSDGSEPRQTTVMLSGTACRYKILPNGRRHILAFQYPGDMTDLYSYVMKRVDHGVGALSNCTVANIPHGIVDALCTRYPSVRDAFWRDTMVDASISHAWTNALAATTAERVANLICEIFVRLAVVGQAVPGQPIPFDATQTDLADSLGLSLVHTNKTIGLLRRQKLISVDKGRLVILDWSGLKAVGQFDPAYLHFKDPPP